MALHDQLDPVLPHQVDILESAEQRVVGQGALEAEHRILHVLEKQAGHGPQRPEGAAQQQTGIARPLGPEERVEAGRDQVARRVLAALEQFAHRGEAGGQAEAELRLDPARQRALEAQLGADGRIGPVREAGIRAVARHGRTQSAGEGAPAIVAQPGGQHDISAKVDGILHPQPPEAGLAIARIGIGRARGRAPVGDAVGVGRGGIVVRVGAEGQLVPAQPPLDAERPGVPARVVADGHASGAARRAGQIVVRGAHLLLVDPEAREVERHVPSRQRAGQLEPGKVLGAAGGGEGQARGVVGHPVEADIALVDRGAGDAVDQPRAGVRQILPGLPQYAERADLPAARRFVADPQPGLVLRDVDRRGRAEHRGFGIGSQPCGTDQPGVDEGSGDRGRGRAGAALEQVVGHRLAGVLEVAEAGADRPGAVLLLVAQRALHAVAAEGLVEAVFLERHQHRLDRAGGRPTLARGLGGDRDHPAHRMAVVAGGIGAIDDIELAHLGRADHVPLGREIEPVAEEVGHHEAVDQHDRAGALHGVGAAHGDHGVVIPGEALPHEEVGRVLHQVLDVDRVDRVEVLLVERDRQPAWDHRDRGVGLADDDDGIGFGSVSGVDGSCGQQRRGDGGKRGLHGLAPGIGMRLKSPPGGRRHGSDRVDLSGDQAGQAIRRGPGARAAAGADRPGARRRAGGSARSRAGR